MKLRLLMCVLILGSCGKPSKPPPADAPVVIDAAPVGPCDTPTQLAADLATAAQADVISLSGVNPISCPEVAMTQTWSGGKLIFSDSPEKPTARGKLYEDNALPATEGTDHNRVFVYHVNGSSSVRLKFTVMIKNNSGNTGTLVIERQGTAGPTTAYAYAGKLGFQRWLTSTAQAAVQVPPGGWARVDSTFDSISTAQNYLMHGIWDYSFSQEHTVTVCALEEGDDPNTVCPGATVLARDTHHRGTFPHSDKVYDTAANVTLGTVQSIPIAGNTENDSDALGVDKTDGTEMRLQGNYGVLYKMHLGIEYGDKNAGLLLNPRGGGWGGAVWVAPGLLLGGKFLIPAGSGTTSDNTKGAVAGRYAAAHGAPWMQFMPTGGSSLPVRLIIVAH